MELNRSTRTTRAPTPKTVPTHFFGTESHTGQKDLPFTHHPDDTRRVGTIVALWDTPSRIVVRITLVL